MRSQKEILNKIEDLTRAKADPLKIQRSHLVRKLTWENARPFLHVDYILNPKNAEIWKKNSRLDEPFLMHEIDQFLFDCYEHFLSKSPMKSFTCAQYLLIWLWLLGPKHDDIFRRALYLFTYENKDFNLPVYDAVVKHFGWKRSKYMRDWEERGEDRESGIVDKIQNEMDSEQRIIFDDPDQLGGAQ